MINRYLRQFRVSQDVNFKFFPSSGKDPNVRRYDPREYASRVMLLLAKRGSFLSTWRLHPRSVTSPPFDRLILSSPLGRHRINKIPRIRPKRSRRNGRRLPRWREKWDENLIFRIKNIEIQNPSLPRHKLSRAP